MEVSGNDLKEILSGLSDKELEAILNDVDILDKSAESNPLLAYVPTDRQRIFENDRHPISFFFASNSGGKTYSGTKQLVCHMLGYDPSGTTPDFPYFKPPIRAWFASIDMGKAKTMFVQDIMTKLPKGYIAKYDNQHETCYGKNGSICQLMSYKTPVSGWQSEKVHFALLDEQPPMEHYDETKSRIIRVKGFLRCTMSPLLANSRWTYDEIFMNIRHDENISYHIGDLEDNIYLSREIKEMFYSQFKGTADENARLHGNFTLLEGTIHKRFGEENIIKPDEFDIKDKLRNGFKFCRIIDAHFEAPVVVSWFAYKEQPEPIFFQYQELVAKDMLIGDTANIIKRMSESTPIEFTILDTPESESDKVLGTNIRNELAKKGIVTIKANRNQFMGIDRFNDYLENTRFFITEDCTYSIYSIKTYSWSRYNHGNTYDKAEKESPTRKDNHPVRNCHFMALRMPSLNEQRDVLKGYGRSRHYVPESMLNKTHGRVFRF